MTINQLPNLPLIYVSYEILLACIHQYIRYGITSQLSSFISLISLPKEKSFIAHSRKDMALRDHQDSRKNEIIKKQLSIASGIVKYTYSPHTLGHLESSFSHEKVSIENTRKKIFVFLLLSNNKFSI